LGMMLKGGLPFLYGDNPSETYSKMRSFYLLIDRPSICGLTDAQAEPRRRGQRERKDGQTPRPQRHRRAGGLAAIVTLPSRVPTAMTASHAGDRWPGARRTVPFLYLPCPSLPSGWALADSSGIGSRVGQCAVGTVGSGAWPSGRPGWTWRANASLSCMLTFESARSAVRSLALLSTALTGESPVEREADLVDQAPLDGKGPLVRSPRLAALSGRSSTKPTS
jgi:hypothetical protein